MVLGKLGIARVGEGLAVANLDILMGVERIVVSKATGHFHAATAVVGKDATSYANVIEAGLQTADVEAEQTEAFDGDAINGEIRQATARFECVVAKDSVVGVVDRTGPFHDEIA